MREKKVFTFNKFKEKLVGLKTLPLIHKEKYPAVILVHGFGVTKEESTGMFSRLAKKLSQAGFLVYRFDFSGCGESRGDYQQTSLSKLKSDLKKILTFVCLQPEVNKSKIGILAQSFGTTITVSLAPKIKCLVLTGAISRPHFVFRNLFDKNYNPQGISSQQRSDGTITKVGPQFWQDFNNYNPTELIKKIRCPILFIHGSNDEHVPISDMEACFKNANWPKKKIIIKGASHGLKPHRQKMFKIVVSWFKKHLA